MTAAAVGSDLPLIERPEFLRRVATASDEARSVLRYDWRAFARPEQLPPPGNWRYFLALAGRGWGKSRASSEFLRMEIMAGRSKHAIAVAATSSDCRETLIEGPAGIMQNSAPWFKPKYEPSKRRVVFPNGGKVTYYSSEEPDRLRGVNADLLVADELAAWKGRDAWDMALLGLRIGSNPRAMITTTPRPTALIKELMEHPDTALVRGSTMQNARNLAPQFLEQIVAQYEGTRLYDQEILGKYLTGISDAIVTYELLDSTRVSSAPELAKVVVGLDPAATNHARSDLTGISVAGRGTDGDYYVLSDRSCRMSPENWAARAVEAYHNFGAEFIVAEANQGGDMVRSVINQADPEVPVRMVHALKGKAARAMPVLMAAEQKRLHMVGRWRDLEDELASFSYSGYEGGSSPDRADALVWAIDSLKLNQTGWSQVSDANRTSPEPVQPSGW